MTIKLMVSFSKGVDVSNLIKLGNFGLVAYVDSYSKATMKWSKVCHGEVCAKCLLEGL